MPRPASASAAVRASLIPEGLKIPRRVSPLIRTWFGQSAGRDGATDVAFVWEPAPRTPGVRGVVVVPARVAMTVSTLDGAEVYSGASAPSGAEAALAPADRPELTFSARPGRLLVQMDVLDPAGRVLDRDVRDVTVTAFHGPVAFGSPSVYRSRSARDVRTLLAGSSSAAPVASRQFSRAEHLVVTIPVVTDGGAGADVTVRLQSRFGSVLRALRVSPSRTRPGDVQVDVPLAPLASGGYLLEFSARSPEGTATERLEFVVTP